MTDHKTDGMIWGTGYRIALIVRVLVTAVLVKYLFFRWRGNNSLGSLRL